MMTSISWNNTGCLYKLCSRQSTGSLYKLCPGWSGTGSCLNYCVQKTQIKILSSSGTLQNTQDYTGKLLPAGTTCASTFSNTHLTKCHSEMYTHMHTGNNQIHVAEKTGLHTCGKMTVLSQYDTGGFLKDKFNRNNLLLSRSWSRSPRSDRHGEEKPDEDTDKLEHRKMMQSLSVDNDMLSRFRNTYMMTLVSFASLQNEVTQLPSTITAVAVATSVMNLSFATVVYVSNLIMLRKSGKISVVYFSGCVVFAAIHFVLWTLVLTLIFPDSKVLDEELKRYTGED